MIMMKSYSFNGEEKHETLAFARAEGIDASYKDLSQVCARIRGKPISWAMQFLEKVSLGSIPVLYSKFNTNLGHRRELGGKKGRYPKKAAFAILKVVKSAAANARVKGLSDELQIIHVLANKKSTFPRIQAKGRRFRADFEISRVEIVVKGEPDLNKKVEVKPPVKKEQAKAEAVKQEKTSQMPVQTSERKHDGKTSEQKKTEDKKPEPKVESKTEHKAGHKEHAFGKEERKSVDISKIRKEDKKI